MATVLRPPIITRLWSRDPAGVAVRAQGNVWQNGLPLLLRDKFYGLGGPSYDYPNPRGYVPASTLRTWAWSLPLSLRPQPPFATGGFPKYDYPNPRGPLYPISLRTWTVSLNAPLQGVVALEANYDWPNPRGPLYSIDLRTWINQGNIQLGRVIGIPTLAFTSDKQAITCTASDSPSGQNWSGRGYMARYEIDTPVQIEGIFLDALNNVYVDPNEVQIFIKDPAGAIIDYTTLDGTVVRQAAGHYTFTFEPDQSGTYTYKWQGTGTAAATSPDTTFTVNSSALIAG